MAITAIVMVASAGIGIQWWRLEHAPPPAPPKILPQPEPPDPGPVSVECKPYSSSRMRGHSIDASEVLKLWNVKPSSKNPHPERMDCWNYGRRKDIDCNFLDPKDPEAVKDCKYAKTHDYIMCDDWAGINAQNYSDAFVFPLSPLYPGQNVRLPNGGGVECKSPFTADTVNCTVEINEPNPPFDTVGEVDIACTSKRHCDSDDPKDMRSCCRVLRRRKVFRRGITLTKKQELTSSQELANNRIKRYLYCKKWCEDSRYAEQCADYWDNGKIDLDRKKQGLPPRW